MLVHATIVIPVLNGARFLSAALDSIAAQTLPDFECLIMDGGSTDGSQAIAQLRAEEDRRFVVRENPGQDLYAAVFEGLDRGQGRICAWLGSDDLLAPWALATAVHFMNRTGARWISGMPSAWDDAGRLRLTRGGAWRPRRLIAHGCFHEEFLGFIQQESVFFDRSLYGELTLAEKERIVASRYAGDYLLWRMFAHRESLAVLPAMLGGFRIHGGNLSRRNLEAYMAEVRASGAPMPPPRIGRRAGIAFQLVSTLVTWRAQQRALRDLSAEAGGAGSKGMSDGQHKVSGA